MSTSNYIPKVGDKVRAMLGENKLVGEVVLFEFYGTDFYAEVNVSRTDTWGVASKDGWQFEQIVEVPTKNYALVGHPTEKGYVAHVLVGGEWYWLGPRPSRCDVERVGYSMRELGFEVLFEGVDE